MTKRIRIENADAHQNVLVMVEKVSIKEDGTEEITRTEVLTSPCEQIELTIWDKEYIRIKEITRT